MCTFMENVVGGNKFRSLYSTTNESNTTGFIQFIQASKVISLLYLDQFTYQFTYQFTITITLLLCWLVLFPLKSQRLNMF